MQRRDLLADDPTVKLEIKGDKVPPFGYSVELFHLCIICIFFDFLKHFSLFDICTHSFHHLLLTSSSYSITTTLRLLVWMSIPSIQFQVAPTYSKLALPIGHYFIAHSWFVIMVLFTFLWCLGFGLCGDFFVSTFRVNIVWKNWDSVHCFLSLFNLAVIEVDIVLANDTPSEIKV